MDHPFHQIKLLLHSLSTIEPPFTAFHGYDFPLICSISHKTGTQGWRGALLCTSLDSQHQVQCKDNQEPIRGCRLNEARPQDQWARALSSENSSQPWDTDPRRLCLLPGASKMVEQGPSDIHPTLLHIFPRFPLQRS